ncbi:aspartate/glutamate racemase family protein [Herbaspirillum lusitanum]|uniref:Aspartate/glutamate racemase family protein n=1 Tax=Herbaspirillum lusitanum TaxID=213312 RepID=A0ABW9A525_9BURK
MTQLKQPIGIFDAGIGSYAIVERVHQHFPLQDILYLADRASFPYGAKSPAELLASVSKAADYLQSQGCGAIILASNAPSIMVLDGLCEVCGIPVIGVFPPVEEAVKASASKRVAVLGVKSMVTSEAMQHYVARYRPAGAEVLLINASAMVDLVENFMFLNNPAETQAQVRAFVTALLDRHPELDVMTLSSTHLPWLKPFFEQAAPHIRFLDPADSVLAQISPFTLEGRGAIRCVATETAAFPVSEFNTALAQLGFAGEAARITF